MNLRKIMCMLLALSMLVGTALLFASCSGEDEYGVSLSSKQLELDVADYAVLYANSQAQTRTYKETMAEFAQRLVDVTGGRFIAKSVTSASTPSAKEILIGNTGRAESNEVLSNIKGDGYAIEVVGEKIVLVGTNDLLTLQAVTYFCDKYLKEETGSTVLNLHQSANADNVEMITLASPEGTDYSFIYSQDLYDSKRHPVELLVNVYASNDLRDLPVTVLDNLTQKLSDITGYRKKSFKLETDAKAAEGLEVLVSRTNRPVSMECLSGLGAGDYGLFIKNGQVVLAAYNDAALLAVEGKFLDLMDEATVKNAEGKKSVVIPANFKMTGYVNKEWITDFTKPEGLSLYSALDTGDNSLQYVYMGEGVNADAYEAYVDTLKAEGYRAITENEIEESLFVTLLNDETGVMLYVAYNAYAHQSEYAHKYEPILRVVSSPTKDVTVPDAAILSPGTYEKVTNTSVTAIELVGQSVGMGYIVTLEDGSFVLFDGGNAAGGYEAVNIWNLLNAHYERIFGHAPTVAKPLHIAAWVVTHSHGDHYSVFNKFLADYATRSNVKFDYLIGNYPSESSTFCVYNSDIGCMNNNIPALLQRGTFKYLKVHTGQKYYFANLEMEVLMTYDDLAPARIKNQNDTSTVLRFTMNNTDEKGKKVADPYVMIWTGDANNQQSRYMCAMYGDYLEADMVQVAHHGNIGCESDFYDSVKATVVWFPHSLAGYRSWLAPGGDKGNWVRKVDWKLINESQYTKYVYVSGAPDANNKGMGLNLTLPFGNDGQPMYDKIYNTLDGVDAILDYTSDTVNGGVAIKPPQNHSN